MPFCETKFGWKLWDMIAIKFALLAPKRLIRNHMSSWYFHCNGNYYYHVIITLCETDGEKWKICVFSLESLSHWTNFSVGIDSDTFYAIRKSPHLLRNRSQFFIIVIRYHEYRIYIYILKIDGCGFVSHNLSGLARITSLHNLNGVQRIIESKLIWMV